MDDSKIIELFFERSEQAIIELSKKYGSVFKKLALNILNNEHDAEECLSDAYLGVWNNIPPHKPEHLSGYVCRIVRNTAIKKYHSNTAKKRNCEYDVALDELEDCLSSPISVEDEVDAHELARIIDGFLETLDPSDRIMFVRRYYHSDTTGEIAHIFGTSEHNVSVRLFRVRNKLKKHLIKKGVSL